MKKKNPSSFSQGKLVLRIPLAIFLSILTAASCAVFFSLTGCSRSKENFPLITPSEDVSLSPIKGLAWISAEDYQGTLNEGYLDKTLFISLTEDGLVRLWDLFSGQISVSDQNEIFSSFPEYQTMLSAVFPVYSSDKTKMIYPGEDGSIVLADAASEKKLNRYYGFGSIDSSSEWVSITPSGFYNASFRGSALLSMTKDDRCYNLEQLSGALFRPDIFRAHLLSGNNSRDSKAPITLNDLFTDDSAPPEISISLDKKSLSRGELHITIREGKGGTGALALYQLCDGEEIPTGLYDVKRTAKREYKDNGQTCYEISLYPEPWFTGVSVFNKDNTIESERLWMEITATAGKDDISPAPEESTRPAVLSALLAGHSDTVTALEDFLLKQKDGELFSEVIVQCISSEKFNTENFTTALSTTLAAGKSNVTIIYINGQGSSDKLGNLKISTEEKESNFISGDDIAKTILGLSSNSILLLDLNQNDLNHTDTALRRLRQKLGPRAILAGCGIMEPVIDALSSGLGSRYTSAHDLLTRSAASLSEQGTQFLVFYPAKDFQLSDPLIKAGELKFQTMSSGMLKIDQVDTNPLPLLFGNTMVRKLPPGDYIIDMAYRNGYKETRFVNLKEKDSIWVTFNYTPALLNSSSLGAVPLKGINIAELNPANYEKVNREAMEGMGMAPSYVAYLAGEKFYKEGNYTGAITEYTRAISLKADYDEAYISRGNAKRRTGDYDGAINDYSQALNIKANQAEVLNYRGFAHAQKGDYSQAITDYTQAIRSKADYADAYFNRAYAYGKQKNWDEAIADYTQVIKLEPTNLVAFRERGIVRKNKEDAGKVEANL